MDGIDKILPKIRPKCGFGKVSAENESYYELIDSFKTPKTIVINLSAFESHSDSRAEQMCNTILAELEKANVDWESKDVAVNFEYTESLEFDLYEISDMLDLIEDQVKPLDLISDFANQTAITITYCDAKKIKLAIIGARVFDDYELLKREVLSRFKVSEITQIVCEGDKGAYTLACQFGLEYGIDIMISSAQCQKHGRRVGRHNIGITGYADQAIAFPIGSSRGTYDTIRYMKELGKPVTVIKSRITPENIGTLAPNEVVVEYGPTGRGYDPLLEGQTCKVCIGIGATFQGLGIVRFITFAQANPELIFYVTPVKGNSDDAHIAVYFRHAVEVSNIHLPQKYWDDIQYDIEYLSLFK